MQSSHVLDGGKSSQFCCFDNKAVLYLVKSNHTDYTGRKQLWLHAVSAVKP